ncbi:MAG TPA: ATP synthase F1 subunit gamma [Amoebophilaceae bacterium]|jgi:F-type H+-transporting ATPase subunit gamma|nr:ATP synthase F1 subunit gamma [Amoebophilaceae bacterium]
MAHLKEIVDRIELIVSTQKITKAMKMVAASKLHKTQQLLAPLKEYTLQCSNLLHAALQRQEQVVHPLLVPRVNELKSSLFIVVASDRGLCGVFNKNVLKSAQACIESRIQTGTDAIEVLVIGKKTHQFFKKTALPLIDRYVDLWSAAAWNSDALADYCMKTFQNGYYTEILLVYTAFINAVKQEPRVAPFLPFSSHMDTRSGGALEQSTDWIYEPSHALFVEQLLPEVLKKQLRMKLVESSASEHAARTLTMGKASDNADALLKELRISYNRMRQALITNALAEINGGAEALMGT